MKLIFLGPPGAGKGTQAKIFSQAKSIPHISTGEILRAAVAAQSKLGKQVQPILDSGQLVPDSLMVNLIAERIAATDCKAGYVLDGFPRTVEQAMALEQMLAGRNEALSAAVYFDVSDEELNQRLEHRRDSESRADDNAEVQKQRLKVYRELTAPLIAYYEGQGLLRRVKSAGRVEEVQARLVEELKDA